MNLLRRVMIPILTSLIALPAVVHAKTSTHQKLARVPVVTHPKRIAKAAVKPVVTGPIVPIVEYKGKKYIVYEKRARSGLIKTRIITGPGFSELIYDRDGNGYADDWKVIRGSLSVEATHPSKGKWLKVVVRENFKSGTRVQEYFWNGPKKTYKLMSDEMRKPTSETQAEPQTLLSEAECSAKLGSSIGNLRYFVDELMKETKNSDPISAVSCQIKKLQGFLFDSTCLDPAWKSSVEDMTQALGKVIGSAVTKPQTYLACLSGIGLEDEANHMLQKLYNRYYSAIQGNDFVNLTPDELDKRKSGNPDCDPLTPEQVARGKYDSPLIRCGPFTDAERKRLNYGNIGVWRDSDAGDGQMTLFKKSNEMKTSKISAVDAYASTIFHEMMHSSEFLGDVNQEEALVRQATMCCDGSNDPKSGNACDSVIAFSRSREILFKHDSVFSDAFASTYSDLSYKMRSVNPEVNANLMQFLTAHYGEDYTADSNCRDSSSGKSAAVCDDEAVARMSGRTEEFFTKNCGPQNIIQSAASAIKGAFTTNRMTRQQCNSFKSEFVSMVQSNADHSWIRKLYEEKYDKQHLADISGSSGTDSLSGGSANDAIGGVAGTNPFQEGTFNNGTDRGQTGSNVDPGPSTGAPSDDPIGDLIQTQSRTLSGGTGTGNGEVNPGASTGGPRSADDDYAPVRPGSYSSTADSQPIRPGSYTPPKSVMPSLEPEGPINMGSLEQSTGPRLGQPTARNDFDFSGVDSAETGSNTVLRSAGQISQTGTRPLTTAIQAAYSGDRAIASVTPPQGKQPAQGDSRTGVMPSLEPEQKQLQVTQAQGLRSLNNLARLDSSTSQFKTSSTSQGSTSLTPSSSTTNGVSASRSMTNNGSNGSSGNRIAKSGSADSDSSEDEGGSGQKKATGPIRSGLATAGVSGQQDAAATLRSIGNRNYGNAAEAASDLSNHYEEISGMLQTNPKSRASVARALPYGTSLKFPIEVKTASGEKKIEWIVVRSSKLAPTRNSASIRETILVQCPSSRRFEVGACRR
jgi:hypothetical protein